MYVVQKEITKTGEIIIFVYSNIELNSRELYPISATAREIIVTIHREVIGQYQ